ncbi:MAG: hypothetical protein ACYC48_02640 [Minisyncoccota bacterium]
MNDRSIPAIIRRFVRFVRAYLLWSTALAMLVVIALAFEAGRYSVYRTHPEFSRAEQAQAILEKVGHLIQLPQGETPTMATISDASAVKKGQPFLSNAANGDILIVYSNAAEALLYRPSTDKLIAVGPVNPGAGSQTAAQAQNPSAVGPTASSTTQNAISTRPNK